MMIIDIYPRTYIADEAPRPRQCAYVVEYNVQNRYTQPTLFAAIHPERVCATAAASERFLQEGVAAGTVSMAARSKAGGGHAHEIQVETRWRTT